MMKNFTFQLIMMSIFLAACSGGAAVLEGFSYSNISPNDLNELYINKDFQLINVHIPFDGDLPKTDESIPYNKIDQFIDELPKDKDARIVVYCRSGSMSSVAAEHLASLGYTNIQNLEGGFNAWIAAGYPMNP